MKQTYILGIGCGLLVVAILVTVGATLQTRQARLSLEETTAALNRCGTDLGRCRANCDVEDDRLRELSPCEVDSESDECYRTKIRKLLPVVRERLRKAGWDIPDAACEP